MSRARRRVSFRVGGVAALAAALVGARGAAALDRQGSAHGGASATRTSGFGLSGQLMLGVAVFNPTYAARPDNTGLALLRYAVRGELTALGHVGVAVDATFFTDRRGDPFTPSELDLTASLLGSAGPFEAQLAYERDMPADRGGLVQHFVYALASWRFEWRPGDVARPTRAGR